MPALPFQDPDLPVAERVEDLLARLTIEEKAGQLTQYFFVGSTEPLPDDFDIESLPPEHRAYVGLGARVEAAVGEGRTGSLLFVKDPALANRLQRKAVEESRLGIPLLFGFDVVHGWRTVMPVPIALAATWSGRRIEEVQSIAAREARAAGIHWTFAPMIDIARDPRWGRIVEGAGEDPYLGSVVAAAQVRGFQGDLGPGSILAGAKHFLGYGAARGGRDYDDVEISESELWNVYAPPFRAAIEAGTRSVMSAYMDVSGVPASANRHLLTDVLRGELGFDGFVVSDANAVRSLVTQHFSATSTDAAAEALNAGLDMEMAMMEPAFDRLPEAFASGLIDMKALDDAVRRVLEAKFALGLFEDPYVDEAETAAILAEPSHRIVARSAAEDSFVLLKNDANALPLDPQALRAVAVVGQLADSGREQLGPWTFDHDVAESVTIVDGLRQALGSSVDVRFAPGASIPERRYPTPFDQTDPTVERTEDDYDDDSAILGAITAAASADVAVVVVGQRQNQIGERASTATLDLPGRQLEQLQRIHATGTPVIVVVMSGRPLDLRWADANVAAIVQAWYPGSRGGEALARMLTGAVVPAGRLPFTWPQHVGHVPVVYSHLRTFEPQHEHERYFEGSSRPLYPFGYGLSYATFEYSDMQVSRDSIARGETAVVSCTVTNTSERDADEVVQLYVHQRFGRASRPVRELKGFRRVTIAAGESQRVELPLGPSELRYWSAADRREVQDATTLDVWMGGDSDASMTATVRVT